MGREIFRMVLFRHREALLVILSVPVIVAALRGGGVARVNALLGTGVVAAGVLLRLCAVRRIGRGARVFRAHAQTGLVCSGPYRWTRNPLYLAAALMLCGFGLIAGGGWTALALLPATLLAYTPVVLIEERSLVDLLGDDYRRYLAEVPRWIGWARADHGESDEALVDWREVLHREKRLVPGSIAACVAIAACRNEWLPVAQLARGAELVTGFDLTVLVSAAMVVAIAMNAIKVERHQDRRRAARSTARGPAVDR